MKCFVCLALLLAVVLPFGETLRRHGDPNPGLQFKDVRPNPAAKQRLKDSRLLGGEVAAAGSAPWQVSLQNQYGNHFCGGVIIDQGYVLTAASCVAGLTPRNVYVITGTDDWMGLAIYYEVSEIIIHCNFDKPLYHNDIALIKLATLVAWNDVTQNITVAEEDELVEGEVLTMTGWGAWEVGGWYPNDLKVLEVKYMPYEKCKSLYGNLDDVDVGHLCTTSPVGEGACHGDTGGPLINSKGELVGINNFGIPCGYGFPDVFARLSFYHDWLRTSINGCKNPT